MKRLTAIITAVCMAFSLSACGNAQNSTSHPTGSNATVSSNTAKAGGKAISVYFSRVGNTAFPDEVDAVSSATLNRKNGELKGNAQLIAEWAADAAGCETFEIVTEESYPSDYDQTVDLAKEEQTQNKRPALKNALENAAEYDMVYLSFPNWWADMPMAVYSFFDAYDFSGKTINVFITHEGSGFSRTINTIRELEPGATVNEALAVRGGSVADEENMVREWVKNH